MDVSKNRGGPPKWIAYNGKPFKNGCFGGFSNPYFRFNTHLHTWRFHASKKNPPIRTGGLKFPSAMVHNNSLPSPPLFFRCDTLVLRTVIWLVVSTHLKNISHIGSFPQVGVKIKNLWNHHLVISDESKTKFSMNATLNHHKSRWIIIILWLLSRWR